LTRRTARFSLATPVRAVSLAFMLSLASCSVEEEPNVGADAADAAEEDTGPDDAGTTKKKDTKVWTGKCAGGPTMCDDGNPCTADDCDPHTGCSNDVKDCKDDDDCTKDLCDITTGSCKHIKDPCDDNNICTINVCQKGEGCVVDKVLDCADDDACTADGCSPIKGCVSSPASCDDGKSCTKDSCDPKTGCKHDGPGPGVQCCEKPIDCEDDSPCTVHSCVGGVCQTQPVFGCCKADLDCDDGNGCTTDQCSVATGACANIYKPGAGCCATKADCHDGDNCTLDHCIGGKCGYDVTCCSANSDCNKGGAIGLCAAVTCTNSLCAAKPTGKAGCCNPLVGGTSFEKADKLGYKLLPGTNGRWKLDTTANTAKVGAASLKYEGASKQIAGGSPVARIIFDPVELPAATQVSVRFWFLAQPGPLSPKERFRVRLRTAAGEWHLLEIYGTYPSWQLRTIDLSAFAARASTRKVQLILDVQPSSKLQPTAFFRIDDVRFTSTCKAKSCVTKSQCNDFLAASTEACIGGKCVYAADTEYCEYADHKSCDDGDKCTTDYCSGNTCKHIKKKNCCHNNTECDDKNVCTTDACVNSLCVHPKKPPTQCCNAVADCDDSNPCTIDACPAVGLPCQHTKTSPDCCVGKLDCDDSDKCTIDVCIDLKCSHKNQCCKSDKDCDDGDDKCTTDKCAKNLCSWTPTGAKGCCEKGMLSVGFEGKDLGGFKLVSSLTTSKWQAVVGQRAFKGKGALYYGNPAKKNFNDGKSKGTATTTTLTIPKADKTVLKFALYMDSESSTSYDRLDVYVIEGAKKWTVWRKNAKGFKVKTWAEHTVNLSAWAGRKVQIQWEFDTNDAVANTGEGVYVDEVSVVRTCADYSCAKSTDCNDGHTFSIDNCTGGKCSYSLK